MDSEDGGGVDMIDVGVRDGDARTGEQYIESEFKLIFTQSVGSKPATAIFDLHRTVYVLMVPQLPLDGLEIIIETLQKNASTLPRCPFVSHVFFCPLPKAALFRSTLGKSTGRLISTLNPHPQIRLEILKRGTAIPP